MDGWLKKYWNLLQQQHHLISETQLPQTQRYYPKIQQNLIAQKEIALIICSLVQSQPMSKKKIYSFLSKLYGCLELLGRRDRWDIRVQEYFNHQARLVSSAMADLNFQLYAVAAYNNKIEIFSNLFEGQYDRIKINPLRQHQNPHIQTKWKNKLQQYNRLLSILSIEELWKDSYNSWTSREQTCQRQFRMLAENNKNQKLTIRNYCKRYKKNKGCSFYKQEYKLNRNSQFKLPSVRAPVKQKKSTLSLYKTFNHLKEQKDSSRLCKKLKQHKGNKQKVLEAGDLHNQEEAKQRSFKKKSNMVMGNAQKQKRKVLVSPYQFKFQKQMSESFFNYKHNKNTKYIQLVFRSSKLNKQSSLLVISQFKC